MSELETIPVHILANYMLSRELEAEYLNRGKEFKKPRVSSTTARNQFKSPESRERYFNRLAEARNAGADIVLPPLAYCTRCWNKGTVIGWRGNVEPCPKRNCTARLPQIEKFKAQAESDAMLGLVPCGESQVLPTGLRRSRIGSMDDGVLDCS